MTYVMPERQWEKPKAEPLPAPEVTSRPALPSEIPSSAKSIQKLALRHGWKAEPTYARGTRPGRLLKVVDSLALRLRRDDVRAWAVWLDGKFDTAMILREGDLPREVQLGAIRAELKRFEVVPAAIIPPIRAGAAAPTTQPAGTAGRAHPADAQGSGPVTDEAPAPAHPKPASYAEFLERRRQLDGDHGFAPDWMPDFLFPFQEQLVDWALRKGRGAIFADCGLGKTPMQLAWAENVRKHTGLPVLIVTPLAVALQTEAEAAKFGIDAAVSRNGRVTSGITVTNYDRLHHFNREDFGGVVCDESSAIKAYDGARKALVTDFMRKLPYRLLCTATAAPNDYIELGTSSEALGYLGYMDMLNRFFINKLKNSATNRYRGEQAQWRFKGHAEEPFWRWVSSWARAMRRPSDYGYTDDGFALPELIQRQHVVKVDNPDGDVPEVPAIGLREEREEARRTLAERCEASAELLADAEHGIAWCQLNPEGDRLTQEIDGAVQVKGADHVDAKEEALAAFTHGEIRVLVTKPTIAGWGLNWQHCNRMTFFPSHSYEQYYQAVRRCWRFGQERPVTVDLVTTEGASRALANLERKAAQADRMFDALVAHMNGALSVRRGTDYPTPVEVPAWAS